jgi:hypothetical protein
VRRLILADRRIASDANSWTVTLELGSRGRVVVSQINGDINDTAGIREGVRRLIQSKPRYARTLA